MGALLGLLVLATGILAVLPEHQAVQGRLQTLEEMGKETYTWSARQGRIDEAGWDSLTLADGQKVRVYQVIYSYWEEVPGGRYNRRGNQVDVGDVLRLRSPEEQALRAEEWSRKYAPGTPVTIYRNASGRSTVLERGVPEWARREVGEGIEQSRTEMNSFLLPGILFCLLWIFPWGLLPRFRR